MVPLPKLKSGQKKTHPKKLPKIAKNRQKQGKKHISSYKSNNIFGELYVKPRAESNGITPGLENCVIKQGPAANDASSSIFGHILL